MNKLEALEALLEKVRAGDINPNSQAEFIGVVNGDYSHVLLRDAYNGSLDAALSLHQSVLSGWKWRIASDESAWTDRSFNLRRVGYRGSCPDMPARSLLTAILQALIAQERWE